MHYHEDECHPMEMLKCMNTLRKDQKLCDVIIAVDGHEMPAHRVVLAASSPYFLAMFTGQMEESHQRVVQIRDVAPSAMQMLIDFCYTSSMQVDEENVQNLLPVACLLQMNGIKSACSEFLKRQLDWNNCLGVQAFAEAHNCVELKEAADSYALQHYLEVLEGDEFLELSTEELAKLLASDELNVKGEEQVFESVINWVKHRPDERSTCLDIILTHVRLPLMDPQYLVSKVSSEPLIKSNSKCRDLVDEAKDYLLLPDQRASKQSIRTRPRNPTRCNESLFAVGGWCSGNAISMVERYNPRTDEWKVVATMMKRRCGVGVCVLGDFLYAIGGHDGTSYLNSIERYDAKTNQWSSSVAPTNTCRTSVGVAALDNYIYAVGGQDGVSCLNIVERYDPNTNRWSNVPSMNTRRLGVAVSVLNNHLYVVGGSDGTTPLNSVERYSNRQHIRYDPKTNRWVSVEPMKTRRKHLGTAVLDNVLYAIGGRDENTELNSVEKYDYGTNQWTSVVAMNYRRSGVGLAVVNGHLYAVGGFDGSNYLKSVEWFDLSTNQWRVAGSMNYRRLGGGVGVLKLPET